MLEKTRCLLRISRHTRMIPPNTIPFDYDGDEDDVRQTQVFLDKDVWDDMGSPETVTLTIEPGDNLND